MRITDIFSVDTLQWSSGPDMVEPRHYGSAIPVGTASTLLVVGGASNSLQRTDTVFELDLHRMVWLERAETLTEPRAYTAVVPFDKRFISCHKEKS